MAKKSSVERQLSANEIAELANISVVHLYTMVKRGQLPPPRKFGTVSRWPESEVVAMIEALPRGLHGRGAARAR